MQSFPTFWIRWLKLVPSNAGTKHLGYLRQGLILNLHILSLKSLARRGSLQLRKTEARQRNYRGPVVHDKCRVILLADQTLNPEILTLSHDLSLSHPKYRPDIDGLRALAVLSVVGYHAFPNWVKGGFVGVDIFFVISGYLISSIIFENLRRNSFSYSTFYARRLRRIFPALGIVLLSSLIFGWFVMTADEYMVLGKHTAAGTSFISNFVLWDEAGYFDSAAESKTLLHLWSLGIEEQFYIVWPFFLCLMWKRKFNPFTLILILAIGSFAFNIITIKNDPVAAFYSPTSRFWELLAGCLLAWCTLQGLQTSALWYKTDLLLSRVIFYDSAMPERKTLANVCAYLGVAFLLFSIVCLNKHLSFPGWWAIFPVMGSFLFIMAGPQAWPNRILFSNRVAIWFGTISFPLYLWHWPLLSFTHIVSGKTPEGICLVVLITLAVLLAWLTTRFVEKPIRFGTAKGRSTTCLLVGMMILLGIAGFVDFTHDGLPLRAINQDNVTLQSGNDGGAGIELTHDCGIADAELKSTFICNSDPRETNTLALIGDSKAQVLYPGLVRTSSANGRWLLIAWYGPKDKQDRKHPTPNPDAVRAVANNANVRTVVLAIATRSLFRPGTDRDIEELPSSPNAELAFNMLRDSVDILRGSGKKIVLLVDNPTLPYPEECLQRKTAIPIVNQILVQENPKCVLSLNRHLALSAPYRTILDRIAKLYPNDVRLFDTTGFLCDMQAGTCTHRKNGRFLYQITDHISDYAAGLIGHDLNEFVTTSSATNK